MEIWNTIVQTNTFNFIIFLLIFAWIFKIAKIGNVLTDMQNKVAKTIDDSVLAKEDSVKILNAAGETVKNVDKEVKEIIDNADLSAIRLSRKIAADANTASESILKAADKANNAKGKEIISELSQETAFASIELAKNHIIKILEKKPHYHAKILQDSIDEIDRFSFNE